MHLAANAECIVMIATRAYAHADMLDVGNDHVSVDKTHADALCTQQHMLSVL